MKQLTFAVAGLLASAISLLAIGAAVTFLLIPTNAYATVSPDQCNDVFEYTKVSDFSDSRININFESSDHQIDVSANAGYAITKVELSVDDDGHSGFHLYATSSVNNLNPNPGTDINVAKITAKKVCVLPPPPPVDVCPLVTGLQTTTPCADTLCVPPSSWNTETQMCVTPPPPPPPPPCGDCEPPPPAPACVENCGSGGSTDPSPFEGVLFCFGVPCPPPAATSTPEIVATSTATTTPEIPVASAPSCGALLTRYMKLGDEGEQVTLLRTFLGLPGSLVFDAVVFNAVKEFQLKHKEEVLTPWVPYGFDESPSGWVFKTTMWKINSLHCPTLGVPFPQLP